LIRVLVNTAADDSRHGMDDVTIVSFDAGIAVNLRHQFFASREVAIDMRAAGGGSNMNLGSISWMTKQTDMPVYTISKAAIHGLTRSLARDLGRYHIRVNTLVPGWVMTYEQLRLWVNAASGEQMDQDQCVPGRLPAGRYRAHGAVPGGRDSEMSTAQAFIVDAGWS
jgi:NAD(P)-dependent dehydrogenase (short-subunit alcohol dehydrogenase family)